MSKRVMWTGPFADFAYLHDQMDRIAQEMLTRTNAPTVTTLPVDIYDSGEDIIVQAYVPGVRAEHLDIQIDDDVLTISGSFPQLYDQEESGNWTWQVRELRSGNFQRSLSLPFKVDFDRAEAQVEDGILRMVFPKAAEAKPRRISVSGGHTITTPELSETTSPN
jgi:HSP20 family protein